jgi:hypothetical protein
MNKVSVIVLMARAHDPKAGSSFKWNYLQADMAAKVFFVF